MQEATCHYKRPMSRLDDGVHYIKVEAIYRVEGMDEESAKTKIHEKLVLRCLHDEGAEHISSNSTTMQVLSRGQGEDEVDMNTIQHIDHVLSNWHKYDVDKPELEREKAFHTLSADMKDLEQYAGEYMDLEKEVPRCRRCAAEVAPDYPNALCGTCILECARENEERDDQRRNDEAGTPCPHCGSFDTEPYIFPVGDIKGEPRGQVVELWHCKACQGRDWSESEPFVPSTGDHQTNQLSEMMECMEERRPGSTLTREEDKTQA